MQEKKQHCIKSDSGDYFRVEVPRYSDHTHEDRYASMVCRGYVTYSALGKGRLGTASVQDGVAVIMQGKKIKKLALAYVLANSSHIVADALTEMPQGEKNFMLVGSSYPRAPINIENVLRKLSGYPFDISINQSYILDGQCMINEKNQFDDSIISCYETNTNHGVITVDPDTLKVTNKYPVG